MKTDCTAGICLLTSHYCAILISTWALKTSTTMLNKLPIIVFWKSPWLRFPWIGRIGWCPTFWNLYQQWPSIRGVKTYLTNMTKILRTERTAQALTKKILHQTRQILIQANLDFTRTDREHSRCRRKATKMTMNQTNWI